MLYAADQPEGAVHESILHDAEPGTFVPRAHWQSKILSAIRITTDLTLASFHSDGLRRYGLYPADLTDTDSTTYPHTVRWAEAAWRHRTHGVAYMCRHYNSGKAVCLFGDRLPADALRPVPGHPDTRVFVLPVERRIARRPCPGHACGHPPLTPSVSYGDPAKDRGVGCSRNRNRPSGRATGRAGRCRRAG